MSTAPLLYNPLGGAYYRSLTVVALLSRGIRERTLRSAQHLASSVDGLHHSRRTSDEVQRCLCDVECTAIIGHLWS